MFKTLLTTTAALALVAGLVAVSHAQSPGDLAIVAHPETPVAQMSLAELRQVMKGDRQYWKPDLPVVLFVRAATSEERTGGSRRHLPDDGTTVQPVLDREAVPR